jgi:hypothetical protein
MVKFAIGVYVVSLNISTITVHVDDYLLKMPPDTLLLCLNCFVDGDQPNQTFTVEIRSPKMSASSRPDQGEKVPSLRKRRCLRSRPLPGLFSSTILLPSSHQVTVPR